MEAVPSIEVTELTKRYGTLTAVDNVSFRVEQGEIFGILGPNGAGKTTTLEMIEGLRVPDSGSIFVAGIDVRQNGKLVREKIGVQLQQASLFDDLTVLETVSLFRAIFKRKIEVKGLLESLALEDKAKSRVKHLSGGQKQRLSVLLALVNDPEIVFFDEPTTGLDPQGRRSLWDNITATRSRGKTVILTTHYMEEAEALCDRVAIMDHGRIIALDSPRALIQSLQSDSTIECAIKDSIASPELEQLEGVSSVREAEGRYLIFTRNLQASLIALMSFSAKRGFVLSDLRVRTPSLEDVFISLTGRRLRE